MVLVYPLRPPYHLAHLLSKVIFPSIAGNPVAPVFGYKGKIYGTGRERNLTRILVENRNLKVCIIHHSVPWNRKRVRDFIEVMKHYDSVKVFIRYLIVGILGIVINLLLFFTFYQLMGIDDLIALWAAIEISILITFFLNNYWVYFNRKYTRSLPWRMGAYHLTMITGIVMNIGIYKVLAVLGVNYLLGDLIGILVSSVWNFYMTNAHVFFAAYLEENSKM